MSTVSQGSGPTTPLLPGDPERIGGYTLLGRLGGGGMGTVFLARSAGGRVVALKTVHEHLAREPEFRIRFRLEAEAARTIGARHGATVVAADTQGALPWLATEYLLGPSLAEAVVRHGPLPETAVRALGSRLAQALADIHGSGLVHRDLKPSNVLVTAAGPRVIDFGIARALGARRLTRTGQAVGTPAYMSPEQAGGRDHEPPGDVFALAGVLVFAATGHAPFAGEAAADLLYGVRYGTPDFSGLPAGLLPVLLRCLAKDPDDRPADEEIAAELGGGEGNFADLLPGPLRSDLGRRAVGVWDLRPTRLPGPPPPPEEPPPGGRPADACCWPVPEACSPSARAPRSGRRAAAPARPRPTGRRLPRPHARRGCRPSRSGRTTPSRCAGSRRSGTGSSSCRSETTGSAVPWPASTRPPARWRGGARRPLFSRRTGRAWSSARSPRSSTPRIPCSPSPPPTGD